ncbi:hypothetical protein NW768_004198 [Fusarium equiseti]|uniref:Uncharacterized protein n=1 Tax=Fusarium equiseti TaxID=61235 RepID=A0ABQ8RJS8_FUSEQ|nr:hypothetical protein NW768_004198 [Fusarium equiseti]
MLKTQVVSSRNEPNVLPQSLLKAGVKRICEVRSTLTELTQDELVLIQKHGWCCFGNSYKYYRCDLDVRFIVTPADLRFELWFKDKKFSRGHEPIKVEWI